MELKTYCFSLSSLWERTSRYLAPDRVLLESDIPAKCVKCPNKVSEDTEETDCTSVEGWLAEKRGCPASFSL
jgi:hypothetical protein